MSKSEELLLLGISPSRLQNAMVAERLARMSKVTKAKGLMFTYGKFASPELTTRNIDPYSDAILRLREISIAEGGQGYRYNGYVLIALDRIFAEDARPKLAVLDPGSDQVSAIRSETRPQAVRLALSAWLSGAAVALSSQRWDIALAAADQALDI